MGEKFYYYFSNDQLKNLVKLYGTTDKKKMQALIKETILNDIENKILDIDDEIKLLRVRRLKAQCRIDEQRATYYETFGTNPTPQGDKAIKSYGNGSTATRPTTITEQDRIMEHFAPIEHQLNEIYAMCVMCEELIYGISNGDCIAKCGIHLQANHPKEILK